MGLRGRSRVVGEVGSGGQPGDRVHQLLADAQGCLARAEVERAEALVRQAITLAPEMAECHNALGVVFRVSERLDAAILAYEQAIALEPKNPRAHNNLGDAYKLMGDYDAAVAAIGRALSFDPNLVEGYRNLAQCYQRTDRLQEAAEALEQAIRLSPNDPGLYYFLAAVEHDRRNYPVAIAAYRAFLDAEPDHVAAQADLGMALIEQGRTEEAYEAFSQALTIAPRYAPAEFGLQESISRMVPPWHLPMMNENKRNFAYRDAIRAVVKPDDHVLEIGTGAGLLALLSAEAGARQVTTCEMVAVVAAEAKEIIANNPGAERITVVAKPSTRLEVGVDLAEKADVLVSEILANDFVGEGVLPSLIDAKQRLLKPDARVIPAKGAFMGVLAGGSHLEYLLDLGDVCGFDMRRFTKFKPWRQVIPQHIDYEAFSADTALLSYDFHNLATLDAVDTVIPVQVTKSGRCYGVLQWIWLELAAGITYDNHPRTTESVWNKVLYAFPEPVDVFAGDVLNVRLWQKRDYLYLTIT